MAYTVNAQVGGKVAQLGQRLIDGAAKSLAEDFFKRFDKEMQRRFGPPEEEAAPADKPGMMSGLMKKMGIGKKDDAPDADNG